MVLLNNKDWEVRKIPLALDIQGQIISWFSECLEKYLISSKKLNPGLGKSYRIPGLPSRADLLNLQLSATGYSLR